MERLFGMSRTGFLGRSPVFSQVASPTLRTASRPEVQDMMRMNRAVLAAFLCSAVAPATCDPFDRGTPFDAAQWPTLSEMDPAFQRAAAASSTTLQTMPDVSVVIVEPPVAVKTPLYKTVAEANGLPSTATSAPPNVDLQSRVLIACLGFVLAVAGGVMLLLPRK